MDFENCEYFSSKLIEDDIFGHPSYEYYCSKNEELKEVYSVICIRCCQKRKEKING